MTVFAQIRESAVNLSKEERAELAVLLLDTLETTGYWVDDEEIVLRSAQLDSSEIKGVSVDEFRKLCGR